MQSTPASRIRGYLSAAISLFVGEVVGGQAVKLWSSERIPTTSERRPISVLKRSSRFVERGLREWAGANA
jgi:hypothetical protein